jgi:hypothetical protein
VVPAISLLRYRGAAKDGVPLEYVFETDEQYFPRVVSKKKIAEIAAEFMPTFTPSKSDHWKAKNSEPVRSRIGSFLPESQPGIAARLTVSVRRIHIELCSAYPLQALFALVHRRLARCLAHSSLESTHSGINRHRAPAGSSIGRTARWRLAKIPS